MTSYRYRLTAMGWIGAALFVLPTPIAAWEWHSTLTAFAARSKYERTLEEVSGVIAVPEFSTFFFTVLATASLVGLVMVLVGREMTAT